MEQSITFKDDKLGRKRYSDFLTEIVLNPDKYKRLSDSKSMTIAIDSGWGTGKTTFLNMWYNELKNKPNVKVVTYNAWKNDFTEDAFQSFSYQLLNSSLFSEEKPNNVKKKTKKDFAKACCDIALCTGKFFLNQKLDGMGDAVAEIVKDTANASKNIATSQDERLDFSKEYENYFSAIKDVKEILREVSNGKQIIIIVDELDRCKPLFAIKLLESIKHIFDVENVTFVFGIDMQQLSYSVKCVYGDEMDASGYLCRFFDYISKMTKPNLNQYINYLIEERPLKRKVLKQIYGEYDHLKEVNFNDIFLDFAENMNLSLRDVNTIYSNFLIFEELELKNTECMEAYSLYLMLLILKYKYSEVFNRIFVNKDKNIASNELFSNYTRKNNFFKSETISYIINNDKINEKVFEVKNEGVSANGKITENNYNNVEVYKKEYFATTLIKNNSTLNVSNCLFCDDINKWDEIKEKTLSEYIQEKLEFFDFGFENKKTTISY